MLWVKNYLSEIKLFGKIILSQDYFKQADLVLVLHDAWNPSIHQKAEEVLRPTGIPWLRGYVLFGEGVIGPLVRSDTKGCSQCADIRHLMAGQDRKEMWEMQQMIENGGILRDVWATSTGLLQVARILGAEVQRILQGKQGYSEGRLCFINLKTLNSSWHAFLPDPLCPICSQLPDDSLDAARISLKPSPKIEGSYRCRSDR